MPRKKELLLPCSPAQGSSLSPGWARASWEILVTLRGPERPGTWQQQEVLGSGSRGEACRRGRSGQGSGEEGEGPWRCRPGAAGGRCGGWGQVGLVCGSRSRAEREKGRRVRREAVVRGEGEAGARSGA